MKDILQIIRSDFVRTLRNIETDIPCIDRRAQPSLYNAGGLRAAGYLLSVFFPHEAYRRIFDPLRSPPGSAYLVMVESVRIFIIYSTDIENIVSGLDHFLVSRADYFILFSVILEHQA